MHSHPCSVRLLFTVSPSSAPRIARSSSIPAQDSSFELFGSSNLGSSLSLADRPKGTMTRSGSFRDPADDGEYIAQM